MCSASVGLSAGVLFNGVCSSKVLVFISSTGFVIKMGHTENMINLSRNVGTALTPGDAHLESTYKGNCFADIYEAISFQYLNAHISLFRIALFPDICIFLKVSSLCEQLLEHHLQVRSIPFLSGTQNPVICCLKD